MGWGLLLAAGIGGIATLGVALFAALDGWVTHGQGLGRVALHVGLLGAGAALFGRGLALRRRGQPRQAALALGLLALVTLPYAVLLGAAVYLFALGGERF
jgi:hypothetical protein